MEKSCARRILGLSLPVYWVWNGALLRMDDIRVLAGVSLVKWIVLTRRPRGGIGRGG